MRGIGFGGKAATWGGVKSRRGVEPVKPSKEVQLLKKTKSVRNCFSNV